MKKLILSCLLLAIDSGCHASAADMIANGTDWKDTSGNHISCHEGGISRFGRVFYWYGTSYRGNPKGIWGTKGNSLQNGFNVYSSSDLINWDYKGVCLDFSAAKNKIRGTAHRPNVVYSDSLKKYIMWFFDLAEYPDVMMTAAVANSPTGPFEIVGLRKTAAPNGFAQDCGLFTDDDGKSYLVYDDGTRNLRVDLLSSDLLELTGKSGFALAAPCEGAAMIKYKGHYIVAGSGVCGWGASETVYSTALSPLGPYSQRKQMSEKKTWGSQISNFLYIKETDTVMAVCDQWWAGPNGKSDLDGSRYLFLPVAFDPKTGEAKMEYRSHWNPLQPR